MKVYLEINDNNGKSLAELSSKSLQFGRSKDSDIPLNDSKTSGSHCKIFIKDDLVNFSDLNSKNGTYINGTKANSGKMYIGDKLTLGDSIILISLEKNNPDIIEKLKKPILQNGNDQIKFDIEDVDVVKRTSQKKKKTSGLVDNKNLSRKKVRDDQALVDKIEVLTKKKRKIDASIFLFLVFSPYLYLYLTNYNNFNKFKESWAFLDPEFEIYTACMGIIPILFTLFFAKTSNGTIGNRITKLYKYEE